jgi:hypothetical protein
LTPRPKPGSEHVGKAYRGSDGVVRWVTHQSQRGRLHCLWLDEADSVWFSGASYKPAEMAAMVLGPEHPCPEPGETYKECGVFGRVETRTMPETTP